jgi:uncharacterized glyoxalase superfamily protein PhnB
MAIQPDMVGLNVRDMGAALRFYRLLGMDIPSGVEKQQYVEVVTPNNYRISWNAISMVQDIFPESFDPAGHRVGLAFRCDSPDEVDSVYRRMVQAGYTGFCEPWDAFWGQHYAVVMDPDGNLIDLFARR